MSKKLEHFMQLVFRAVVIEVNDSPYITRWTVSSATGHSDNEVLRLGWSEEGEDYTVVLTEGGIEGGEWDGDTFSCEDRDGDEVEIQMYRLTPLI